MFLSSSNMEIPVMWAIKWRNHSTLSSILVDQSISITVYSHSIWEDSQHYHKESQNLVWFSCYVVLVPVWK